MRFISTTVHGALDYVTALVLLVAPFAFGFADGGVKQWLPMILGVGIVAYSLMTDYELSAIRKISMPVHLMLDLGGGVLLAVSPWLFGFANEVYGVHLAVGIFEIASSLTTRRRPDDRTAESRGIGPESLMPKRDQANERAQERDGR